VGKGVGLMTQGCVMYSHIPVYHINNQLDPETERVVFDLFDRPVYVSVISRIEVLGWKGHTGESWEMTNGLLKGLIETGLGKKVVRR
jgi:hypothetical protein